jgi:hypothetical protein
VTVIKRKVKYGSLVGPKAAQLADGALAHTSLATVANANFGLSAGWTGSLDAARLPVPEAAGVSAMTPTSYWDFTTGQRTYARRWMGITFVYFSLTFRGSLTRPFPDCTMPIMMGTLGTGWRPAASTFASVSWRHKMPCAIRINTAGVISLWSLSIPGTSVYPGDVIAGCFSFVNNEFTVDNP